MYTNIIYIKAILWSDNKIIKIVIIFVCINLILHLYKTMTTN